MKRIFLFAVFIYTQMLCATVFAASIQGQVKFVGNVPEPEVLNMSADPTCANAQTGLLYSEKIVVNENGTLRNVFVYLKEGVNTTGIDVPSEPVILNQEGCRYEPHVFGLQVGQKLEILNSDATLHNVHGMPKESKEFNLGMPIKGMKLKRKFDTPEIGVKFKCDVHPWMSAYAGVVAHPFFVVTDDQGHFNIENVPAGQYTLEVWHEAYGTQSEAVTVGEGVSTLEFTFHGEE